MIKLLNQKLLAKHKIPTKADWTILIGQHRGGGLRQIVVRSDELALTRVTPVEEPKQGYADVWAKDVSNEIQATLSYLSRFGYVPDDGLNIVVLGNRDYADLINGMISVPSNFELFSPIEAGSMIGVHLNAEDGEHFADGLYAGWIGRKLALDLSLMSREVRDIAVPRKIASVMMVLLTLGLGGAMLVSAEESLGYYKDTRNLDIAKAQLAEIQDIYQKEIKRKEALGIPISLIKSSLDIDGRISRQRVDILSLLKAVSDDMNNLRLDSLEFKNEGDVLWSSVSQTDKPPVRQAQLELSFSYAGNTNPQDGNKEMDEFVGRLNPHISTMGYKAEVSQPLQNLTYSGEVDRELGLTANERAQSERYKAKILIKKVDYDKNSGK